MLPCPTERSQQPVRSRAASAANLKPLPRATAAGPPGGPRTWLPSRVEPPCDPEVFAKEGTGKVRGLSRRAASRQLPCLVLRSLPLQPSLQQPRCFPPPAACHFRQPGCRSWLLPRHASSEPPTTKIRAASERRHAGTTGANNKKRQTKDHLSHARAAATETTPHRDGRGNQQQKKATEETTTQGP